MEPEVLCKKVADYPCFQNWTLITVIRNRTQVWAHEGKKNLGPAGKGKSRDETFLK
jgi:hypothetical protein